MSANFPPWPGDGPSWADLSVIHGPDRRTWAAVGAVAVLADLAVRAGPGLGLALLVALVAAGLVGSGRLRNRPARALALAAPAFGLFLAVRLSPWVVALDAFAAAGLLVLAASFARQGDPLDLSVPALVGRGALAAVHGIAAPGFALAAAGSDAPSAGPAPASVGRGMVLAAPVVAVIGVLLGSADPVFASFFPVPADAVDLVSHAVLLGAAGWGMTGLFRIASAVPFGPLPPLRRSLGFVEAATVLGALVALYAAFAVAQVVAVSGAARHVLETAGLTYADYARSGFFQLLAVATITLAVVLALQGATDLSSPAARRRFVVLAEVAVVLTLVVVAVAVRRLQLYEQAYGLTMLRLLSTVFALWIAVVFGLLALSLAGVHRRRRWLVPGALTAGLVALMGLTLANPEAVVVERNARHHERTGRLDPSYLARLSDDAVPALVAALPRLDAASQQVLREAICARPGPARSGLSYNRSAERADEARSAICRGRP